MRSSSLIFGLPRRRPDRQRQYQRKTVRCQPAPVSGLTIKSTLFHLGQKRRT
jgi:hypothetical protein